MKILCIGDLHGKKPKIHFKDFDVMVCIGDVCSDKEFRPLKNQWVKYNDKNPANPIGLDPFIVNKIGRTEANKLDKKSLLQGRKILEYLNSFGKPVFMIPGNWDQSYGETHIKDMEKSDYNFFKSFLDFWRGNKINLKLTKGLKNIIDCQFKLINFKGYNLIGYGNSSLHEDPDMRKGKAKKRRYSGEEFSRLKKAYQKIIRKLEEVYKKRDKKLPTIFLTHNVPHNTRLDTFEDKKSKHHKTHFGSTIARQFCDKHQPLLCIGGHMHEHFGKQKLKKTTVINVGFGSYVNTLIELDKGKIKKIRFWDGKKQYKIKK